MMSLVSWFFLQQRRNGVPFQIYCVGFPDLIFIVVCTELTISEFYLKMQNEFLTIKMCTDTFP